MATRIGPNKYRTQVLISKPGEKRAYKSFTGKNAREADMLAEQWKVLYLPHVSVGTFGQCAEQFLDAMKSTLSPSTLRSYNCIRKSIEQNSKAFYRANIGQIRAEDFYPMYDCLKSPKTVRNWNGFISSVFAYKEIPMPKVKLPEKKKNLYRVPDEKEVRAIAKIVKGTNLEIPFALAIRGMRRGEIAAVRAEDIDGNILHIHRALVYTGTGYVEKQPKTLESDRFIPLPKGLARKIKKAGKATEMTPQAISCAFDKMLKRNGIEHFRFHDLRHAFVSIAHANGIPDSYIMAMGGWSTDRVMRSVYMQTLPAHALQYQNAFERAIKGV